MEAGHLRSVWYICWAMRSCKGSLDGLTGCSLEVLCGVERGKTARGRESSQSSYNSVGEILMAAKKTRWKDQSLETCCDG